MGAPSRRMRDGDPPCGLGHSTSVPDRPTIDGFRAGILPDNLRKSMCARQFIVGPVNASRCCGTNPGPR